MINVNFYRYDFLYFWEVIDHTKEIQKIYLGPTDKPAEVTALTGNDLPKPIITKGPELILMFATDELITDTGFNLYFEAGKLSQRFMDTFYFEDILKSVLCASLYGF